jgi:hypothetical protein
VPVKGKLGLLALMLASTIALGGCTHAASDGTPPDDPENTADGSGRVLLQEDGSMIGFSLTDCVEWGGTYPVDSGGWNLPAGFAPMETSAGMTFLLEVYYFCTSGTVPVNEHLFMLPVVPPPDLANDTARFQVLLLAGLSTGTEDLWADWGFADVLVPGRTSADASTIPTFDRAWQATAASWEAYVDADLSFTRTEGEAGLARLFHPTEPTRIVHISWSAYENRDDGGTSLLDARGIPAVAAAVDVPILTGVPFARSGDSYHWEIRLVEPR